MKRNVQVATLHPVKEVVSCYEDKDCFPDHLQDLVNKASQKLTTTERQSLSDVIGQFTDIFVGPGGTLRQTNVVEHHIDTGDAKPIKLPPRRLPIQMRETAEAEIEKMLQQGVIEPSN